MSILLIGEKNRHFPSQRPRFAEKEEVEEYRRTKKLNQNAYRQQLIEQMRQTEQRRRKERQKQIQLDLKYQKIFLEQAYEYQQRIQNQSKPSQLKYADQEVQPSPFSFKPNRKHHLVSLPQIQNQNISRSKPNRYQTEPNQYSPAQYNFSRVKSRQFTEQKTQPLRPQIYYSTNELNTPEARHKKLQEQLDTKLNEVYSLMAQSVKTLHQSQELDQIGSRLAPIKLNLERGYKVRYPESMPTLNNPEENKDYYKLPSIAKMPRESQMLANDSEVEWREWYAKQKLKELQSRYRKDLNVQASDIKLFNKRISTPKFRRPQY